jgi:hypothetical protein
MEEAGSGRGFQPQLTLDAVLSRSGGPWVSMSMRMVRMRLDVVFGVRWNAIRQCYARTSEGCTCVGTV